MGLDIRTPIGLMFGLVGAMLVIYGFVSDPAIYQRSLGINVNVGWGVPMFVFGVVMAYFGRRATKRGPPLASGEARASGH